MLVIDMVGDGDVTAAAASTGSLPSHNVNNDHEDDADGDDDLDNHHESVF